MIAEEFYQYFEGELGSFEFVSCCKRMASKILKWKYKLPNGDLTFSFSTNSKVSGLYPLYPGEFRLEISWKDGRGKDANISSVSLFQYTSPDEVEEYSRLQRNALAKYLANSKASVGAGNFNYADDPSWIPRPNIQEWCYYFDKDDVINWATWYKHALLSFIVNFQLEPESNENWCWRVLWPHLKSTKNC